MSSYVNPFSLTLSWRWSLSYRNQSNQWTGSYMIETSVMKELIITPLRWPSRWFATSKLRKRLLQFTSEVSVEIFYIPENLVKLWKRFLAPPFKSSHRRYSIKKAVLIEKRKKAVLKNFAILTGKNLCRQVYLKRDSNAGVFLWILRKAFRHLFWRTSVNRYFCPFKNAKICEIK